MIGRAHNSNGWGPFSQVNIIGISIETEPLQMSPPTLNTATSTNTLLALEWSALTTSAQTGGASIDSYQL